MTDTDPAVSSSSGSVLKSQVEDLTIATNLIVKNSIVTVAGLLSRIPSTPKMWQQIEVNDGQLGSILYLSYNHLSPHLRKCFLYMAAFPQHYDIHASELIKLWVAEGFIEWRN